MLSVLLAFCSMARGQAVWKRICMRVIQAMYFRALLIQA
jgi:hypothetical protein